MQQANECENNLMQQLHTLTSCPWQQQVEIIKSLKPSPHLIKLINHRNYSSEIAALFAAHNPRTKLITVLTDFLLELFSTSANQIIAFANLLVSNECLLRLLASGNKVVSSCANETMKSIIGNIDFRTKGKQVKFVSILEQEFLSSKNNYVREKISLYFLLISTSYFYNTHEALAEFERKIVKEGLQDANQKVRANMRQILENIHHFEKENNLVQLEKALTRKSTEKVSLKSTKITKMSNQNKSVRVLNNSSINQSSIIQSFVQGQREGEKHGTNDQSFQFYLQKLRNGNTWSMILLAYESLVKAISNGFLKEASDQLVCETLQTLTPYLTEKRSKIYESTSKTFHAILLDVKPLKKERVIAFCQEYSGSIIQQAIKNQSVASLILPTIITLNPLFFIPKIAEISANVKVSRQKWLLLDSIVTNMQPFLEEAVASKTNKKISAMIKAMCHHVEQSTIKQKEVSLAALAIISQLKSKYPDEVLTALLCQSDKSLSRILELAESIDPSLKTAIIDYINSLKSSSRRATVCHSRESNGERKAISDSIEMEMIRITQGQVSNLNKLGQMLLTYTVNLDSKLFKKLISLLQFLYTSDLIMEYKILMEQLARVSGGQFLSALIDVLTSGLSGEESKEREFHDLLLLELLQVRIGQERVEEGKIIKCLIEVYRGSASLKKRNVAVEVLTQFQEGMLGEWLNEDELLLVAAYKEALHEQLMPADL